MEECKHSFPLTPETSSVGNDIPCEHCGLSLIQFLRTLQNASIKPYASPFGIYKTEVTLGTNTNIVNTAKTQKIEEEFIVTERLKMYKDAIDNGVFNEDKKCKERDSLDEDFALLIRENNEGTI